MNFPNPKAYFWPEQKASFWITLGLASIVCVCSLTGGVYIELARGGAVIALAFKALVELRNGQKRFLTSPLFLLSGIGVLFFSVAQRIWAPEEPWPSSDLNFTLYVGSQAETIILVFCMASLGFYQISSASRKTSVSTITSGLSNGLVVFLFLLPIYLTIGDLTLYSLKADQTDVLSLIYKMHFVIPPLIILSISILLQNSLKRGWLYKVSLFLLVIFVLAGLLYVRESKVVLFTFVSIVLYALRLYNFSIFQLLLAALIVLFFISAIIMVLQHTNWKSPGGMTGISYLKLLRGKGVLRQTETGHCLSNVLKAHSKEPLEISKQTFWIEGLIPRILWENKPSLSLGGSYAVKYCSKLPEYLGHHSASITLLGQPVIQGGVIGLILHGGILLLVFLLSKK